MKSALATSRERWSYTPEFWRRSDSVIRMMETVSDTLDCYVHTYTADRMRSHYCIDILQHFIELEWSTAWNKYFVYKLITFICNFEKCMSLKYRIWGSETLDSVRFMTMTTTTTMKIHIFHFDSFITILGRHQCSKLQARKNYRIQRKDLWLRSRQC
jgi:hypothetical protein